MKNWKGLLAAVLFSLSLISAAAQTVTVTSPNGGNTWTAGSSYSITWTISGSTASINYQLVALSTDGGNNYANISVAQTPATRSFNWTIPAGTSTSQARIRVRALDVNAFILAADTSDGNFTISAPATIPASPTSLTASGGTSSIGLSWQDNANNEQGFYIERKIGSGGTWGLYTSVGANVTSYTDTGVVAGNTYYYRVYAYNATGSSQFYSNEASAALTGAIPASPTSLTAAGGTSSIVLAWQDNANNEQGFKIERKIGAGGTWGLYTTVGANVTGYTDTGVAAGNTYYYRVYAYNATGSSQFYSNEASAALTGSIPSVSTQPANPVGSTTATLNGQIVDNGGSAILERRIEWAKSAGNWGTGTDGVDYGFFSDATTPFNVSGNNFSLSLSGFLPNTGYKYRVWARNSVGWSDVNVVNVETFQTSDGVPASPTSLTASGGPSSIVLGWQDNANNEQGFRIERKIGAGGTWGLYTTIGANVTGYTDTAVVAGNTYYYRVYAYNLVGPSPNYSNEASTSLQNLPNLTPYPPPNWSDKIVVSRAPGNNTDSASLTAADTLYVDWAVVNFGTAGAATFSVSLSVDDVVKASWTVSSLSANYYVPIFDYNLGSLSSGQHTITITADSNGAISEGSEVDNSYTKTINIGGSALPDFQITSITLNPASPQPGQAFTANVTVKNQGTGSGDGKWLDVWANQPSVQTCGTDGNTWAAVGTLTSLESKTFPLNLTAPWSSGTYTFRAFVDSYCQTAESSEGNNQATLIYTVGSVSQPQPNFVVTAITFNPAQPVGGQPFTASVTVKNQGDVSGDAKYLDVWVNQPSSQSCGTPGNQSQSVGTLSVNQTKILTYNLVAPSSGSPWTFRAFVDSTCQTPESNEGDNQLTASYGINPVAQPDFTVTSISISPSNVKPGDKFSAFVTVKNLGLASGNAGWLDIWANKPAAAGCGESGDAYSAVGTLAPNESKIITIANLTAGPAGDNTLRAFIDSECASSESDELNNQKTFAYTTSQRVLLLLHGMNAGPDTWDDYIDLRFNGSAPIISGGINVSGSSPIADANGVVCYRVDFGWYEINGLRTGLEGITAGANEMHGDFSTFTQLGQEVWDAVHYILTVYPGAQVTLLGHSRGGLAARAFMQTATSSPEKSSVVALLTTGTPHKGSRLGRIYSYLGDPAHPRTMDSSKYWKVDWDVADAVKAGLDVRRPTISDLSDDSSAISSLSSTIVNLPSSPKYGAITYTSVELGLLQRDVDYKGIHTFFDYSIFADATQTYSWVGPKVSTQAETFLLGSGNTPITFPGDGIVPVTSQRYDDISGFPGSTFTPFPHTGSTIHTEEPGQEMHMSDALNVLVNW